MTFKYQVSSPHRTNFLSMNPVAYEAGDIPYIPAVQIREEKKILPTPIRRFAPNPARKIRATLNKLTKNNADRIGDQIQKEFQFKTKEEIEALASGLSGKLRTVTGFTDLYTALFAKIASKWQCEDQISWLNSNILNQEVSNQDLIGNLVLAAHISSRVPNFNQFMTDAFDKLLADDFVSDDVVEVLCNLIMSVNEFVDMHEHYLRLVPLRVSEKISSKTKFMLQDLMDSEQKIRSRANITPVNLRTITSPPITDKKKLAVVEEYYRNEKRSATLLKTSTRKIKFGDDTDMKSHTRFEPISPSLPLKGILSKKATPEIKFKIHEHLNCYLCHQDVEFTIQCIRQIVEDSIMPLSEMVQQILSFAIVNKNDDEIRRICSLVKRMYTEGTFTSEAVRLGLIQIVAKAEDFTLDCPKAKDLLRLVLKTLNEKRLVDESVVKPLSAKLVV